MLAIEAKDLYKRYSNGIEAIIDVDLSVKQGEIYGLLGPNGAGKTTTVRLLNGTLIPTRGTSIVLGTSSQDETVRKRSATLAELAQMYEQMSALQNLEFFAAMYDMSPDAARVRIRELLERMQLWDKRDLKLGSFSTGMKKRIYLARTLLHSPQIIFLDEPTAGLDPEAALQVTRLIRRLAEENDTTIFLCTHNLPLAETICDTFGFLRQGRLVKQGGKDELIRSVMQSNQLSVHTMSGRRQFEFRDQSEINRIIAEVMSAGANVTEVIIERPTLQDVYFHYVGKGDSELA